MWTCIYRAVRSYSLSCLIGNVFYYESINELIFSIKVGSYWFSSLLLTSLQLVKTPNAILHAWWPPYHVWEDKGQRSMLQEGEPSSAVTILSSSTYVSLEPEPCTSSYTYIKLIYKCHANETWKACIPVVSNVGSSCNIISCLPSHIATSHRQCVLNLHWHDETPHLL